jgi:hypothetical protein
MQKLLAGVSMAFLQKMGMPRWLITQNIYIGAINHWCSVIFFTDGMTYTYPPVWNENFRALVFTLLLVSAVPTPWENSTGLKAPTLAVTRSK